MNVPCFIPALIDTLKRCDGLTSEGIFRIAPAGSEMDALRESVCFLFSFPRSILLRFDVSRLLVSLIQLMIVNLLRSQIHF